MDFHLMSHTQPDQPAHGKVCRHLLKDDDLDYFYHFAGDSVLYNLICHLCKDDPDQVPANLQDVPQDVFDSFSGYAEGIVGNPGKPLERKTDLKFTHVSVSVDQLDAGDLIDVAAINRNDRAIWFGLSKSGEILQIDLSSGTALPVYSIPVDRLAMSEKTGIIVSDDAQFVAVVINFETTGIVVHLETKQITMHLNRGRYHANQTPYPAAFFESEGRTFLVHATNWNRLDISDPQTGDLVTEREHKQEETRDYPDHFLNYFHARLVVSPSGQWIAEDGWIWAPVGRTRVWNLSAWLTENKWESEDGESVRYLTQRGYSWNGPLCWVDDTHLAIWGFGDDDEWMIPAVQLFDVESGKRKRWFLGPKNGLLVFDGYLFSSSEQGTDVWDIDTGERLLHDETFKPLCYHHGAHQFLTLLPDGGFRLSKLDGRF